ncbi:MAG TPA: ferric reductase-like transmembrane domain-containing protein [Dehalococcoidia bacterium]|nr:ferric reductase-like transmembrane domain-containing protein [Dehalococcoidia bacterium]
MNHEFWYLSRAAGFTAYLLLFVSVALGMALGTRLTDRLFRRNAIFDLHRFTTILALLFTLFHVYVLLGDGFFNFNVWQLSVPFWTPYRTWQTAIGIVSLYLMLLVVASFYVRQFIGYRAWRVLHFLTFALYAGATLHGITAGTDTSQRWAQLLYLSTGTAVVALIMYRIQYRIPDSETVRTLRLVAGGATIVTAVVLVFGTGLLSRSTASGAAAQAVAASPPAPQAQGRYPFLNTFDANFSGTYTQSNDNASVHLTMDGTTDRGLQANVHIELVQVLDTDHDGDTRVDTDNDGDSRVSVNLAQVIDSSTNAELCNGQLTALEGNYLAFRCAGAGPYSGVRMTFTTNVNASNDGSFSGPLSGNMVRRG